MALTLSIVPTSRTVSKGAVASYEATATGGRATLGVLGLPSGVTPTFGANPIGPDASTTLTIPSSTLDLGTLSLTLTGESMTGNIYYAVSCEYDDVVAAIALAEAGDIVIVPGGVATWMYALTVTKGILLLGNGEGSTYITAGTSAPLVIYEPSSPALDESFRFSGFNLDGNSLSADMVRVVVPEGYILHNIRFDHCEMSDWANNAFVRYGSSYGVMDHVHFLQTLGSQSCDNYCPGGGVWNWLNEDVEFGSPNQFYYEDCIFENYLTNGANPIACGHGSRYCSRHNTFINHDSPNSGYQPLHDAHGSYQYSELYSTMVCEIYENTITDAYGGRIFDHRGSMALCYNNICTPGGSSTWICVRNESVGDGSPIAGCVDQMLPTESPNGETKRIHKSYYWGNRAVGAIVPATIEEQVDYEGSLGLVPQANRDFYNEVASFDGSVGVGVGLLAARPGSGLAVGVGYFATDTGLLYRATSATTWETLYTPYTYPHPHLSDPVLGD